MSRPNVFLFDDPSSFLRSCFEHFQRIEPDFTLRRWAVRMGLGSPAFLASALRGRRKLKLKELETIIKGLDLNLAETRYLQTLVLRKSANSEPEKQFFASLLEQLRSNATESGKKIENEKVPYFSDNPDLFSHWMDAAVMSALQLKKARENLDSARNQFLWVNDPEQMDRSIEKLRKMGFLDEDQKDGLSLKYDCITTHSDRVHAGGRAFLQQMTEIAGKALELPFEEREFQCFSIPVNHEKIGEFKQAIREFRKSISEGADGEGDIIYQFNFEMFPLSKRFVAKDDFQNASCC